MNRINGGAQDSGESEFIDSFRSLGSIRTQQQQQQEEALQMPQQHRTIEHSKEEQHTNDAQQYQIPGATARFTFVNAKQYRRILKRREARAKIEEYFNKKRRRELPRDRNKNKKKEERREETSNGTTGQTFEMIE